MAGGAEGEDRLEGVRSVQGGPGVPGVVSLNASTAPDALYALHSKNATMNHWRRSPHIRRNTRPASRAHPSSSLGESICGS